MHSHWYQDQSAASGLEGDVKRNITDECTLVEIGIKVVKVNANISYILLHISITAVLVDAIL